MNVRRASIGQWLDLGASGKEGLVRCRALLTAALIGVILRYRTAGDSGLWSTAHWLRDSGGCGQVDP